MKKLLTLILILVLLLSGCEKNNQEGAAPESLFQMEGEATAAGVRPGDGPEEFQAAYRNYTVQVAYNDLESSYMVMSIDRIPYEESISTIIASLFINGEPLTEEQASDKEEVEADQLHALLSSTAYLLEHEVIYRCLVFDWEDGIIQDIHSEELNYNETFDTPYKGM